MRFYAAAEKKFKITFFSSINDIFGGTAVKYSKRVIPLILSAFILVSCSSENKVSTGEGYTPAIELNYLTLDDVQEHITDVKTDYENMSIDPNALNALADNFPEKADCVKLRQISDFDNKYNILRPYFISDESYDDDYFLGFDNSLPAGYSYDDGYSYLNISSNGGIGFTTGVSAYDSETVETIFVDWPYEDKKYILSGKEYSISDGVDYVNDFLERLSENGCGEMRIGYVDVLKYKQEYAYFYHIQRTVDGMELNRFFYSDGDFDKYPYFGIKVFVTEPDKINEFLGNHGFCVIDEITDSPRKYVSLQSALDQCENILAANHKYNVKEIGFGYIPEIRKENGSSWNKETDGQFYFQENTGYYAEPGWFIWLDTTRDYERLVFINAITGEAATLFNNVDI